MARYGAYPVVWCLAGDATMPFYGCVEWPEEKNRKYRFIYEDIKNQEGYASWARDGWTELTQYVRSINAFGHPVTIHSTNLGYNMVNDPYLLDINMLQTSHGDWNAVITHMATVTIITVFYVNNILCV